MAERTTVVCPKCGTMYSRLVVAGSPLECHECQRVWVFNRELNDYRLGNITGAIKPKTNNKGDNMRLFQVAVVKEVKDKAPKLMFWKDKPFFASNEIEAQNKGLLMAKIDVKDADGIRVIAVPFE